MNTDAELIEEVAQVEKVIFYSDANLKNMDLKILKELVISYMLDKKRPKATEIVARWILNNYYIYTTASDKLPETWIYDDGIYIPNGKSKIKEICVSIFLSAYTSQIVNEILFKIEARTFIETNDFFAPQIPHLACVLNGVLDITTGELVPHTPERIFFNKHPVTYLKEAKCDNWIKHINTVLENNNDRLLLQELFGFCLLKDYRFEKAFMLNGTGRNGKGKTLETLKSLLGAENCSAVKLQDIGGYIFAAVDLLNKNANICGDLPAKGLTDSGSFKTMSGHDMVTFPRKNKDSITGTSYAKLIFSANEIPKTCDDTDAFFDRWYIIDFPFQFLPENEFNVLSKTSTKYKLRDPEIISKLTTPEELSGILNWSIEGLNRLLINKYFTTNQTMSTVKSAWLRRSDSFAAFCLDHIEDSLGVGWEIGKEELRKYYQTYCKTHGTKLGTDKYISEYLKNNFSAGETQKTNRISSANSKEGYMDERFRVWTNIRYVERKEKQQTL